jgi:hypothetical protein
MNEFSKQRRALFDILINLTNKLRKKHQFHERIAV